MPMPKQVVRQVQKPLRAKTVREMQVEAAKESGEMNIQNISNQVIPIHMRPPKDIDFYLGAQDVRLHPNKNKTFKKSRLWLEQIERLQKQRKIQVLSDTAKS